jgi:large subunit ribosomal protein L7e
LTLSFLYCSKPAAVVKTTVPESVLKKRKAVEKIRAEKIAAQVAKKKENKVKRGKIFKRAQDYVKEYKNLEREKIRLLREAKANKSFYVPAEAKLAFIVRIKG